MYAWTGSATSINASDIAVNNSINTYDGTSVWTSNPKMLWKDMTSSHYFLGIYPSREVTNFTADSYSYDSSKSEEENDLLVAINTGQAGAGFTATNTPIGLQFDHVMAKLIVNLSFRNQWTSTPTVSSITANIKTNGSVNYLTKTMTATGESSNVTMQEETANAKFNCVAVPQDGENISITIKINDKLYTYTGNVKLEGGKYTTVNLNVGRDVINLSDISINDWGQGETITGGEAQIN